MWHIFEDKTAYVKQSNCNCGCHRHCGHSCLTDDCDCNECRCSQCLDKLEESDG